MHKVVRGLAIISPVQRPERKLDDVVRVWPSGAVTELEVTEHIASILVRQHMAFVYLCPCGTLMVSHYEIALDEAKIIHNQTLCPLQRKSPRRA